MPIKAFNTIGSNKNKNQIKWGKKPSFSWLDSQNSSLEEQLYHQCLQNKEKGKVLNYFFLKYFNLTQNKYLFDIAIEKKTEI